MCCTGKKIEMTSGYPKLDQYLTGKLGQTANQYPGPVSAQMNPLMMNAANMMSMYGSGQPYQQPGYNTYASMMPQQAQAPAQGAGGSGGGSYMEMLNQLMNSRRGGR